MGHPLCGGKSNNEMTVIFNDFKELDSDSSIYAFDRMRKINYLTNPSNFFHMVASTWYSLTF